MGCPGLKITFALGEPWKEPFKLENQPGLKLAGFAWYSNQETQQGTGQPDAHMTGTTNQKNTLKDLEKWS